jgi:hypothetical protein
LYNDLTDNVENYVRLATAEMDAYSELQYAWTFVRENRVADFQVKGEPDPASLETLQSVFFTFRDPAPLQSGWFAIRTVRSHLVVKNLKIQQLAP